MKRPGYAPIYCCMYPELADFVKYYGYALGVHGSMNRDFDLICVPWRKAVTSHGTVVKKLIEVFALEQIGEPEVKNHGRVAYTLAVSFGECFFDLSFMPANCVKPEI